MFGPVTPDRTDYRVSNGVLTGCRFIRCSSDIIAVVETDEQVESFIEYHMETRLREFSDMMSISSSMGMMW